MTTPTPESVKALADLADRVEAAAGPDRDLDALIAPLQGYRIVDEGHPLGRCCYEANGTLWAIPRYTASLDAAMSLLNKTGVLLFLSDIGADGLPLARVGCPGADEAPIFSGIASSIMTDTAPCAGLALALTAAALRAHAHLGASHA